MGLIDILQQYVGANADQPNTDASDHFHQAAQDVPRSVLANGLEEAFRSDATPPIPEMAAKLFGQSTPDQRATMLRGILGAIPQGTASELMKTMLGNAASGQSSSTITADQAAGITPQQVHDIVAKIHERYPAVVERLSSFYAQHPDVVKTLGGAILSIVLSKMAQRVHP